METICFPPPKTNVCFDPIKITGYELYITTLLGCAALALLRGFSPGVGGWVCGWLYVKGDRYMTQIASLYRGR